MRQFADGGVSIPPWSVFLGSVWVRVGEGVWVRLPKVDFCGEGVWVILGKAVCGNYACLSVRDGWRGGLGEIAKGCLLLNWRVRGRSRFGD